MPVIRRGVQHGIHVGARDHLAKIIVAISLRELGQIHGAVAVLAIDITDRNDLHALIGQEGAHVAGALAADTDAGEADLAVW